MTKYFNVNLKDIDTGHITRGILAAEDIRAAIVYISEKHTGTDIDMIEENYRIKL